MFAQGIQWRAMSELAYSRWRETRASNGGEAGIRTLGTGFSPYNGLANRRLQPLGHLTVLKLLRILRVSLGSTGHRERTVPKTVPQPVRSLPQVSVAHDIIAIKNAASLVAAQFHRDAFGNAGADHVPDGGATEVVRDAAWAPAAIRARHHAW